MANITNFLNKIKTAVHGKDVRGAIHDAIKQVYDDASVEHDNANMEVKLARGTHNTLNDRLDNVDEIQAQTNAQLSDVEINAKTRGAIPDDSNFDNSPIFQSIINELYQNGGGTLFIPSGMYYINSPLVLYRNITIRGVNKSATIICKIAGGIATLDDSFDYENITESQANNYDCAIFVMPQASAYCIKDLKIVTDSDNKSAYGILTVSSKLSKWQSLNVENFTNGIRCIGDNWFMNINDVRVRFAEVGVSTRNSTSTTKSNTSWAVNNMFVDFCDIAYEWYGLQYSVLNAIACDEVSTISYDFLYSYVSVNGLGSEKFNGTLINCDKSNVVVHGLYTLNCRESSSALFIVDSTNRNYTGLSISNGDIRTEGGAILSRPLYNTLSTNAYLRLENLRGEYSLGEGVGDGCVIKENYTGISLNKKLNVGDLSFTNTKAQYDEIYQNTQNSVIYSNNRITDTNVITLSKNELKKTFTFIDSIDNHIYIPLKLSVKGDAGGVIITDLYLKDTNKAIIDSQKIIAGQNSIISIDNNANDIVITLASSINRPTVYLTLI